MSRWIHANPSNNNNNAQGGNNNGGGGFVMPLPVVAVVPVNLGPTRPQCLSPGPNAYLQGLMANFKNRLTAATQRMAHENLLFLAAIMQLWGDNLQTPVVPVNSLATELERCNWLYDRFVPDGCRWQINIDANVSTPLQQRRANNTLNLEAFNAACDFICHLAMQGNL